MILTLYTRAGCHLCTAAEQIVLPVAQRLGVGVKLVDIDRDPAALAKYDHAVPVLVSGNREISRHRIEQEDVERAVRDNGSTLG